MEPCAMNNFKEYVTICSPPICVKKIGSINIERNMSEMPTPQKMRGGVNQRRRRNVSQRRRGSPQQRRRTNQRRRQQQQGGRRRRCRTKRRGSRRGRRGSRRQ